MLIQGESLQDRPALGDRYTVLFGAKYRSRSRRGRSRHTVCYDSQGHTLSARYLKAGIEALDYFQPLGSGYANGAEFRPHRARMSGR